MAGQRGAPHGPGRAAITVAVLATRVTMGAGDIWIIAEGPCTLTTDGCIRSPNYPEDYSNSQTCRIGVDADNDVPIQVRAFHTEDGYDFLNVNGVRYSGRDGPDGVVPNGWIQWVPDYSVAESGWELCPQRVCTEALEGDGSDYSGCQTVTRSGRTCQEWGSQVPHEHAFLPSDYVESDLRVNYCRNPGGGRASIWCFTTDPAQEWEFCDPLTAMWTVITGSCTVDTETGCLSSPNYPGGYGIDESCSISVDPSLAKPIQVVGFSTEVGYDKLTINGVGYSGSRGPEGVTPSGIITWVSDSVTTGEGWLLCAEDLPPSTTTGTSTSGTTSVTTTVFTTRTTSATTKTATTTTTATTVTGTTTTPTTTTTTVTVTTTATTTSTASTTTTRTTTTSATMSTTTTTTATATLTTATITTTDTSLTVTATTTSSTVTATTVTATTTSTTTTATTTSATTATTTATTVTTLTSTATTPEYTTTISSTSATTATVTTNTFTTTTSTATVTTPTKTTSTTATSITRTSTSRTHTTTTDSTTTSNTMTSSGTTTTPKTSTTTTSTTNTVTTSTTATSTTATTTTSVSATKTSTTVTSVTQTSTSLTTSSTTSSLTTVSTTATATTSTTSTSSRTESTTTSTPEPVLVGGRVTFQADDPLGVEDSIQTNASVSSAVREAIASGLPETDADSVRILHDGPRALLSGMVSVTFEADVPASAGVDAESLSLKQFQVAVSEELAALGWALVSAFVYDPLSTTTSTTSTSTSSGTSTTPAPVDCVWDDWADWTACSMPCGGGEMTRQRVIATRERWGGQSCSGDAIETVECNTRECIVCPAGQYSQLSETRQECVRCGAGRYNPSEGAIGAEACLTCASGAVSTAGAVECTPCRPGSAVAPQISPEALATLGSLLGAAVAAADHIELPGAGAVEFQIDCSSESSSSLRAEVIAPDEAGCSLGISFDGQALPPWNIGQSVRWQEWGPSPSFEAAAGNHTLLIAGLQHSASLRKLTLLGQCGFVNVDEMFCGKCRPGFHAPLASSIACSPCAGGTYGQGHGQSACILCKNGTFSTGVGADSPNTCLGCPPGRSSSTPGAASISACVPCAPGSFATDSSSTACEYCSLGTAATSEGSSLCDACGTGHFAAEEGLPACLPCSSGSFSNRTGSEECDACGPGTFNPDSGSSGIGSCRPCESGTFGPSLGRSACVQCAPGTFLSGTAATSSSECQSCAAGTHGALPGMSTCVACNNGHFSTGRSSSCVQCALGQFTRRTGSSACEACPEGTYAGSLGASECTACPRGRFSTSTGATSLVACMACPAGKFSANLAAEDPSTCQPCSKGAFSLAGSTACSTCESGSYSTGSAGECTACEAGHFAAEPGASTCDACPSGQFRTPSSAGNTCTLCGIGRYNTDRGSPDEANCLPCKGGWFSNQLGASDGSVCEQCGAGQYSGPGASKCLECHPGKYSVGGAAFCTACPAGHFVASAGKSACKECPKGWYRPSSAPGDSCLQCRTGTASARVAAEDASTCEPCGKGTHSSEPGATSCTACGAGRFADEVGLSGCEACDDSSDSPAAAVACCPHNNIQSWPVAGSLYTPAGKSETRIHYRDACTEASSVSEFAAVGIGEVRAGSSLTLAALQGRTPHEPQCVTCGSSDCQVAVLSRHDLFLPGDPLEVQASVLVNNGSGFGLHVCRDRATLIVAGFGCAPTTLSFFLFILSGVVVLTLVIGVLLEQVSRMFFANDVECSMDIHLKADADLPTEEMVFGWVSRAVTDPGRLPRERFTAEIICAGGTVRKVRVEFAVETRGTDYRTVADRLRANAFEAVASWKGAEVEQQPPLVIKRHLQLPAHELFVLLENAVLNLFRRVEALEADTKELHRATARKVLDYLTSSRARVLLMFQYLFNILVAGGLPAVGYLLMPTCEEGYPFLIHLVWACYVLSSSVPSLMLLRHCLSDGKAMQFCRRCFFRLLLRVVFGWVMLTDTYQDATFAVIAEKCGFDLWFASMWLIILGVGVMQVLVQLVVLFDYARRYRRATMPEQRQRLLVEGAFLALRGSDNLVLTYVVRPAVEERLGGESSWAMKMSEARIAFFRFIFEDVEQSALQVVFLRFYEDASVADQVWVRFSITTSLLLSATLVVQCLPEVRDWLWYRVFAFIPGSRRFPQVRMLGMCFALALYWVLSTFPWISACSPSGDPCEDSALLGGLWGCSDGKRKLLWLPARMEVVLEVLRMSSYCLAVLVTCVLVAGLLWWFRRYRDKHRAMRCSRAEKYDAEKRFAMPAQLVRPIEDADGDPWLEPARELHRQAHNAPLAISNPEIVETVRAVDKLIFDRARGQPLVPRRWPWKGTRPRNRAGREAEAKLRRKLKELEGITRDAPHLAASVRDLSNKAEHAIEYARVREVVPDLLQDPRFLRGGLRKKAKMISEAAEDEAALQPLLFVHWHTLRDERELPKKDHAMKVEDLLRKVKLDLSLASISEAERCTVCFFLSHRWLRTEGDPERHHPDTTDNRKARLLCDFAQWYKEEAERENLKCEVAFWIDWSCCDQTERRKVQLGIAALPLYIAACSKVLVWRTNDFERRCWTMVERLLAYSFCVDGLRCYVIDETFKLTAPEEIPEDVLTPRPASLTTAPLKGADDAEDVVGSAPGVVPEETGTTAPSSGPSPRSRRSRSELHSTPPRSRVEPRRRARKLLNPLEKDICNVSRTADRCELASLVNTAMAAPAFEVYANRQPVEWMVTEIIEESLAMTGALPDTCTVGPPEVWLEFKEKAPKETPIMAVDELGDVRHNPGTDVWVVQGHAPARVMDGDRAAAAHNIEELFQKVHAARKEAGTAKGGSNRLAEQDEGVKEQERALIQALRAYQQGALESRDLGWLYDAVDLSGHVQTPERKRALEFICGSRVDEALETGEEAVVRSALELVERYNMEHVPRVGEVRRKQEELREAHQEKRLGQALDVFEEELKACAAKPVQDERVTKLLFTVNRIAVQQKLDDVQRRALELASKQVQRLTDARNKGRLQEMERDAMEGAWDELAQQADKAVKIIIVQTEDDWSKLLWVERWAQENNSPEVEQMAAEKFRESVSGAMGRDMARRPDWDALVESGGEKVRAEAKLLFARAPMGEQLQEEIQRLVDSTFNSWGGGKFGKATKTRDRKDGDPADKLKVMHVVRVQNGQSFLDYCVRRREIAAKRASSMVSERAWGIRTAEVSFKGVEGIEDHPVDPKINEYYMWHGTHPKGVAGITEGAFRKTEAGLFGPAVYLAESSLKADEYAKPFDDATSKYHKCFPLLLCRVTLGRMYHCEEREPKFEKLLGLCKNEYDSVCGDREKVNKTFREFVVYDSHQVYPEFIVYYTRVFEGTSKHK